MKKTLLKTMLLLCVLVAGSGTMWGQVTIWSEDFSGYSAGNVPSGTISLPHTGTSLNATNGTLSYACTNGTKTSGSTDGGNTRVYNENTAGGTAPEILVGKKGSGTGAVGGSFMATVPLDNIAGTITLRYKQNANGLKVTITAGNVTTNVTNSSKAEQTVTLSDITADMTSVTIMFEATSTSNVRLDNIVLTGYKANVAITSIAFSDPKTTTVVQGGTVTLTPTILPTNATETVDWESDNTSVATVSSAGVVTGVAPGTAHITVKAHEHPNTIYDVCTVTVTAPVSVTGVSLNKNATTLQLGENETLEATVSPGDATNKNVTWSSSNASKVSVENGVITALALTNGTPVNITVTTVDGGFTATCAVTVNPIPVSGVELDKSYATLKIGKTLQLAATVSPGNATDKTVSWESSNNSIATVSEAGLVTAVAVGTASITAKSNADNTKTATCDITVNDGAIELTPGSSLVFNDFSGAGNSYNSGAAKTTDFTADDSNAYEWSGRNFMSSNGLQFQASGGTITSPVVKAPYGYQLVLTTNNYVVDVYVDGDMKTAVSTKTWILPANKAFTLTNNYSNAAKVTNVTITALKQPVATNVAITDPGTLAKDNTGTFAYTKDNEAECTKTWTSSNSSVINITNAATGAYTAAGRGTAKITLTITPTDATNYREVTAERTVTVTEPVVITANNVTMTYGDAARAIGATTSTGYAGTLTYASNNTSVATVNASGNVTAVAAGTATITISAPADATNLFTAAEQEISVTVNAPTGGTTAKPTTDVTVVNQTLLSNSLPENWTGDGAIWSGSSSYGAVTATGTIGNSYDLKTETINLVGNYTAARVTFQHTGNQTFSTSGTGRAEACKLFVKDGDTEMQLTINTMFAGNNWTYVTNTTDLTDYIGKSIQLIFRYTPSSGNQGKWEVKNFKVEATPAAVQTVTLNANGYATFCSVYPFDFTNADGYTAWYISNVDADDNITFTQITGSIKGGQGILLKGTAGATISLTSANSSNVLSGNMLVGTMAPTYIASEQYFGLSGNTFVPVNAGTVPAGKALLPVSAVSGLGSRMTFVFEDATGIATIEQSPLNDNRYYNLRGQRVDTPKKGMYIVNGKKVVVK